jgi:hypothetical protein
MNFTRQSFKSALIFITTLLRYVLILFSSKHIFRTSIHPLSCINPTCDSQGTQISQPLAMSFLQLISDPSLSPKCQHYSADEFSATDRQMAACSLECSPSYGFVGKTFCQLTAKPYPEITAERSGRGGAESERNLPGGEVPQGCQNCRNTNAEYSNTADEKLCTGVTEWANEERRSEVN